MIDDTLEGAIDDLVFSHVPSAMVADGTRTPAELRADVEDFLRQLVELYPETDEGHVAARVVLADPDGLDLLVKELMPEEAL